MLFSIFFDPENIKKLFFPGLILRFSNLKVLHKGLLMQDWIFRLGYRPFFLFLLHPYLNHWQFIWFQGSGTILMIIWFPAKGLEIIGTVSHCNKRNIGNGSFIFLIFRVIFNQLYFWKSLKLAFAKFCLVKFCPSWKNFFKIS